MLEPDQPDPARQFSYHLCAVGAVGAIAGVVLALGATDPFDPITPALLPAAAMTRWIEVTHKPDWHVADIILDTAIGLMTADIISSWT